MRHPDLPTGPRVLMRLAAGIVLTAVVSACFGGSDKDAGASPDDVDAGQPATVTDRERSAFRAPADGVLTDDQVERYLKVSLLQFDLIRQHSASLHDQARRIEERGEKGGVISGLRNIADAGRMVYQAADVIGGSYVRSARSLGYNPAEMEWVRDRMTETAGYFATRQMQEASRQAAEQMREQARELERQRTAGEQVFFSEDDVKRMLTTADEIEAQADADADRAAARNAQVLRRARSNVTEPMWMQLGWHGGGLFAWAGLADPSDERAKEQLDEYRQIFEDALNNRVSAGMEVDSD